jgi:hypothetical protein
MRKTLLASLVVLAVVMLVGVSTYRRAERVTAQNASRPARKYFRHNDRGIPANFGSDVPGVQLVVLGVLPDSEPGGAGEIAVLRIINDTGRGIDAYTVGGGDQRTHTLDSEEVGWDEQGGFTLEPSAPLIPPHGQRDVRFALGNLQDGWPLHLYAVKWHRGGYEGTAYGARDLQGTLERHFAKHGHKSKGGAR